jgi:hypothetical protein
MGKKITYTGNMGKKFLVDGSAKEFPGNTVICHIPKNSNTFQFLLSFHVLLLQQSWAKNYVFLPPSSWHMTVFEGVCDQVRKRNRWTSKFSLNAPLIDIDNLFITEWNSIAKPTNFQLQYHGMWFLDTMGIVLRPINHEMETTMRHFRDQLSTAFGIRAPRHKSYEFHITIAYQIIQLPFSDCIYVFNFNHKNSKSTKKDFGILTLNEPELAFFADLTNFAHKRSSAIRNCKD